jgi:hypothetical protein
MLDVIRKRVHTTGLFPFVALLMVLAVAGCVSPAAVNPPIVNTTPMGVGMRPAKPPGCPMPLLSSMPLTAHQQIALVDVWGDLAAKDDDLVAYMKREGCRVGADAIVVNSQHMQHEGDLIAGTAPGRYGNIGPGSEANVEQGAHIGVDPQGGGHKHHAVVGEEGHPGRYISGVAIVYTKAADAGGVNNQ